MKKLVYISLVLLSTLGIVMQNENIALIPDVIQVYAGADRSVCTNQSLLMSDLQATITGDVSDGDWLSFGDGRFQPGNLLTVRYSFAQQNGISYVPGPNDMALGFFRLMLISDAPIGGTPQQKVNDEVIISFQSPPPLYCSVNINISLNESCTQKVDATMLTPNPVQPYTNYIITLYDPAGNVIPDNLLTKAHIDKEITYKLGHQCTSNTCWGKFKVEDYFPPIFVCKNDTIKCNRSFAPDSLGFPIPTSAYIDTIIQNQYIVKNWDACSDVKLEFTDTVIKAECARDEDKTITRKWKASDAKGNTSYCIEKIVIKRMTLAQVEFPKNYDGHELPAFECGDEYPKLQNGYPSTDTTGTPNIGSCGNLQYTITDVPFALCGSSYKIARSWFVIEWCSTQSITKNQIIHIKDSKGPKATCLDSLTLLATGYNCASGKSKVPNLISVTDCSQYSIDYSLYDAQNILVNQFLMADNDGTYFNLLPVGVYSLEYVLTDACGNISKCRTKIAVEDQAPPFPACDSNTKVSLDNNGKARLFATSLDDGSIDNCGIASFKVRKMSDVCGFGLQSGAYVDFCCLELGKTIMVALEVTDIHGNTNTCMVEVTVDDKLTPTLTCPPNITLTCSDYLDTTHLEIFGTVVTDPTKIKDVVVNNFYHNGFVGKDGLAKDNCSVTVTEKFKTDIHCHTGFVYRTFVAIDGKGLKDSCTQTITILNPDPFDEYDITWPSHYTGNGCRSDQTSPGVTGKPTFVNTSCGNVTATYEDTKFYIADGACLKIIRLWTVVDWCQFDGLNSSGKWGPYTQVIKLHNTDKPTILSSCTDTTFCSYDLNCHKGFVSLSMIGQDSCTASSDLIWNYQLDIFKDGIIDSVDSQNQFSGELPLGNHKIKWIVSDQCGNTSFCERKFSIKDCKNPTPYCYSSLTLPLDASTGTADIWAIDFDKGSSDNCTDTSDLVFTFDDDYPVSTLLDKPHYFKNKTLSTESAYKAGDAQYWLPDKRSSAMYFDCSDIPDGKSDTLIVSMTVWDEYGNSDKCLNQLILQDNGMNCPDVISKASIRGNIRTPYQLIPKDVIVNYYSTESQGSVSVDSQSGNYIFEDLPLGLEYKIKPENNTNPLQGVSTLDLVHIQRHILGLAPFDDPYKLIASDANSSKSVSASDLVEIRKLILGLSDRFPKDLPSWVFVTEKDGFSNPLIPYNYNNEISIANLSQDFESLNFVAVKIGDVNNSAVEEIQDHTTNRSKTKGVTRIIKSTEHRLDGDYLVLKAGEDIVVDGFQVFLQVEGIQDDIQSVQCPAFNEFDFGVGNDEIALVGYQSQPASFKMGDQIVAIKLNSDLNLYNCVLKVGRNSEIYIQDKPHEVVLSPELDSEYDFNVTLLTNPVTDELNFMVSGAMPSVELNYTISNVTGQTMLSGLLEPNADKAEYLLPLQNLIKPGIYYLQIRQKDKSDVVKFIRIR